MSDNKVKELKDKVVGSVKEGAGKLTDNEELELKGKLQKETGKLRGKVNDAKDAAKDKYDDARKDADRFADDVKDKARDTKEGVFEKTNKAIDRMNKKDK